MKRTHKLLIAGVSVVALGAGGVGIAGAVGGDSEERVTGPEADRATRAAVQAVGGGRVVGVEREDDSGAGWEVEVRKPGGQTVEVHLTTGLERLGIQPDDAGEAAGEREGNDDDD